MNLNDIIRKEVGLDGWKDSAALIERVLIRLNNLHRDAVQRVLEYEGYIKEVGDKDPDIEVIIKWP